MPADANQVTLPDGRRIEVSVSGPEGGLPLVFHHGTPGARTPIRVLQRAAHRRGLRLVAATRPGYGHSTRKEGRTVADVVEDTAAVLQALGADRCLVAGWSGGGPHALACAARLPHALGALVIAGVAPADGEGLDWMAGMGQDNVDEFRAARAGPGALRAHLGAQRDLLKDVSMDDIAASLESLLPPVDRAVLTDEFAQDLAASFHEALVEGVDGWLDDDLAFVSPWGFGLREIAIPTAIWQGSEDRMVPPAHGEWLSTRIPGASAHLIPGEGHLSIALGAADAMLDELVQTAGR
ncbi:MAG: alpha/beta hydrolase [Actinomycetota bacterium]|nr:alpha/beta hydrolase [Actinomycetota bacterium]